MTRFITLLSQALALSTRIMADCFHLIQAYKIRYRRVENPYTLVFFISECYQLEKLL